MREVESPVSAYRENADGEEFEFKVFATELAQALGIHTEELTAAIALDEMDCCEIESGNSQLVLQVEVLNRRCLLRIVNPV